MGSPPVRIAPLLMMMMILLLVVVGGGEGAQWCVARSGASEAALQAALDYACGAGSADCQPVQPSGLCYLPNTLAAHASYAFNSFYQRSHGAPGACDFAGTATITITDPSNWASERGDTAGNLCLLLLGLEAGDVAALTRYGSCTFPSSASTAGGFTTPTTANSPNTNTPTTSPRTTSPTTSGTGSTTGSGIGGLTPIGGGGLTPGNGLTPTTGINSGFGPTVPNTDTDMSGASALLLPLRLFTCCYFLPLLLG